MNRKEFIKSSCVLCGAVALGVIESCKKASVDQPSANFSLDLSSSSNAALKNIHGSVVSNQVVIIRISSGNTANDYAALSQVCTHAGCNVAYFGNTNTLVCPCHSGTFDVNGNVISGPPPSALKKYSITLNGNTLKVSG